MNVLGNFGKVDISYLQIIYLKASNLIIINLNTIWNNHEIGVAQTFSIMTKENLFDKIS